MTLICCVCQKTKNRGRWQKKSRDISEKISHGYCPVCYKRLLKKIDAHPTAASYQENAVAA